MQPTDRNANPHFHPTTQLDAQNPAPANWLGRIVVRVREHFGGVAPARHLEPQVPGVPYHLRDDVMEPNAPLNNGVPRFRTYGIEFRTPESAQRYSAIAGEASGLAVVGDGGGIVRIARRGAITGQ